MHQNNRLAVRQTTIFRSGINFGMGDAYRHSSTHPLIELCFFLNLGLIFALVKFEATKFGCSLPKGGITYSGTRNTTHSERICQNWAVNEPHVVDARITDDMFPDGSKEAAKNYCRNPFLNFRDGVWCYTTDKDIEWQYCDVCKINTYEGYSGCKLADRGVQYRGKLAHTVSFQVCEPWSKHPSNRHEFAEGDAETNKNYCRNPDSVKYEAPMCFIAEVQGVDWEYCDICKPFRGHVDHRTGETGISYSGVQINDLHALACLRLCISVESCTGVAVERKLKYCNIVTKFKYELKIDDAYDRYVVQRVCIPKAAAKGVHFVDSPDVMSLKGFSHIRGSVDRCEKECLKVENCVEYSRNAATEECLYHDSIYDEIQLNAADTMSRFKMRCVPTLKPTKDVAEAEEESTAEKPAEKPIEKPEEKQEENPEEKPAEKPVNEINQDPFVPAANKAALLEGSADVTSPKPKKKGSALLIVVILVAIIALGIGGFAYYKLGYANWLIKPNEKAPDDAVVKPSEKVPEKVKGTAPNKGNEKDPLNAQGTGNPNFEGNNGNENDLLNAQGTGNQKIEGNKGIEDDLLNAPGIGSLKVKGKHKGKGQGKSKAGSGKQGELQKLIPGKQLGLPGVKQSKLSAVNKSAASPTARSTKL